jgi:hypothetical protein
VCLQVTQSNTRVCSFQDQIAAAAAAAAAIKMAFVIYFTSEESEDL